MSRPEEQLACAIAQHHFGPIIGEVVRLLMLQPGCTVMNLLAETETFFQKLYSDNHQGTGRNGNRNSGNNSTTANRDVWMKQALTGGVITSYQPAERLRLLRDALAVLILHDLCFAREAVASSIPASTGAPAGAGASTGASAGAGASSALNHGKTNGNGDANGTAKAKAAGASSPGSPSNKSKTVPFEYFIMIDRLMCRSRIPLYIGFARLRFGSVGEIVVRTLFLRGRMTSHMMFAVALDKALPRLGVSVSDAEACLTDMARSGLLMWSCRRFSRRMRRKRLLKRRAVSNDTDIHENGDNINNPVGTQAVKRRRTGSTNETDGAGAGGTTGSDADDEKPASSAVLSIDYADPEIMPDSDDDDSDDDDSDMSDDDGQRVTVGRGDSQCKVGAPARDNDTDVWTICYWQLNREFRNECCVKVAQTRVHDDVACSVLRIGLQLALEEEDSVRPSEDFETADIATEDIQKVFEQRDSTLSASTFWEGVQVLVNQTPSFVLPIPEHAPTKLRFVPGRLIAEARQKTLEEFIGTRYQPAGRRVFQALAMEGGMVEKMLADKCLLHVKVVRALVYKLYEDNLVSLQEVSRSHDTGTRSNNWFYLWKVNLMAALRNVIQVMYQTSANLFVRLESMDRLHAKYKRNRKSKEELRRIEAQRQVVLGNILRMDQSIMVMRDFGPLTATYFPSKFDPIDGPIGYVHKPR